MDYQGGGGQARGCFNCKLNEISFFGQNRTTFLTTWCANHPQRSSTTIGELCFRGSNELLAPPLSPISTVALPNRLIRADLG